MLNNSNRLQHSLMRCFENLYPFWGTSRDSCFKIACASKVFCRSNFLHTHCQPRCPSFSSQLKNRQQIPQLKTLKYIRCGLSTNFYSRTVNGVASKLSKPAESNLLKYLSSSYSNDAAASEEDKRVEGVSWVIRLGNENNYLSWCRNSYIAVVIGATMIVQGEIPYAMDAATLFFAIGFMNMTYGSFLFCYNCIIERDKMLYSLFGTLAHCGFAVLHLLIWLSAVLLYLGFLVEDPLDPTPGSDLPGTDSQSGPS